MIDLLLNIHKFFYGLNEQKRYKRKNAFMFYLCNIMYRIFRMLVYYWIQLRSLFGIYSKPSKEKVQELIVSFTSFPARIDNVWMVVDSIMRQTIQPEHFILYLSRENFPDELKELPQKLLRYMKYGLEIKFVDDDLRPHKKYLYAFMEFPQGNVVTIDDDIYYRQDLLEHIWELHKQFPKCVVGNVGRCIIQNKKYNEWNSDNMERLIPHNDIIAIGCGGILYPVSLFDMQKVDDVDTIKSCCLSTDDLWLKAMELLCNIPVVIGNYYISAPSLPQSSSTSLSKNNFRMSSHNDENWDKLNKKFYLNKLCFTF